ncbi:hypothetical protein ACFXHA_43140 [Nocardia sp. NPDC059240]|uniref:hypothetical protein n=1 Tax=Nocardia sp. NPDC059240 TaxID=3346786 RepID=UPI0036AE0535
MKLGSLLETPASQADNEKRMHRAAGVSNATLVCHRHTWNHIDGFWTYGLLSRHNAAVWDKDVRSIGNGMVEVPLSGRNLVMLLKLTNKRRLAVEDRILARRVYEQVAKVIDAVDPDAKPGHPLPPIILDDKLGNPATPV